MNMDRFFLSIVNTSISASWLIIAVFFLRILLRNAPKGLRVLLWGLVALRLLLPFSIESSISLIPSAQTIPLDIGMDPSPAIHSGIEALNSAVNPILSTSNTPMPGASVNPLQITIGIWSAVWMTGVELLAVYAVLSYWRLRSRIADAVRIEKGIYKSDRISSAFILGVFKPKIYLPFGMDRNEQEHVIRHEMAHIRRKDHWWKPLGFLLLMFHWFNPFVWVAYVLLCRDIELACDESVIRRLDHASRADYSQALLNCSVNRSAIVACPLAFGEVGVKERIRSVMNYKKPAFWLILTSIVLTGAVAVFFLTDPPKEDPSFLNYKNLIPVAAQEEQIPLIKSPKDVLNAECFLQYGYTEGSELAKYLEQWSWKECAAPKNDRLSAAFVQFQLNEQLSLTVYQHRSGSMRYYGKVQNGNEVRFYRVDANDYPDAASICFGLVEAPEAVTWFDEKTDPYAVADLTIPTLEGIILRCTGEEIIIQDGGAERVLITGMPVLKAYLCDLNFDGIPELCAQTCFGSGMIDERVYIYDFAKVQLTEYSDRGTHDYSLTINEHGCIYLVEKEYATEDIVTYRHLRTFPVTESLPKFAW